jgi:hypothetical protein
MAYGVESATAAEAPLTVDDVDRATTAVQRATGSGSSIRPRRILADLFGEASSLIYLVRGHQPGARSGALTTGAILRHAW